MFERLQSAGSAESSQTTSEVRRSEKESAERRIERKELERNRKKDSEETEKKQDSRKHSAERAKERDYERSKAREREREKARESFKKESSRQDSKTVKSRVSLLFFPVIILLIYIFFSELFSKCDSVFCGCKTTVIFIQRVAFNSWMIGYFHFFANNCEEYSESAKLGFIVTVIFRTGDKSLMHIVKISTNIQNQIHLSRKTNI